MPSTISFYTVVEMIGRFWSRISLRIACEWGDSVLRHAAEQDIRGESSNALPSKDSTVCHPSGSGTLEAVIRWAAIDTYR